MRRAPPAAPSRRGRTLLERGAAKVYAAARNPDAVDLPGVVPIRLDVTDPASVAAAAAIAGDVTLLVNNAGSSTGADLLHGDIDDIRLEMETHYFGTLNVTRAFAPVLAANGRGAVLTITTTALHVGYMDTDMAAGVDAPESDPAVIAGLALDGVAARAAEVLADDLSRQVRAGLSGQLVGTP